MSNRDWEKICFYGWANHVLQSNGITVSGVESFEDGVAFYHLYKELTGKSIAGVDLSLKAQFGMKEKNLKCVVDVLNSHAKNLGLVEKNPSEVSKSEKDVIDLLWVLILGFVIPGNGKNLRERKKTLKNWIQDTLSSRKIPCDLHNFNKEWADGKLICGLVSALRPDFVEMSKVVESDPITNVELAFSVAEKELTVPRIIALEHLAGVKFPKEKTILLYISLLYKLFPKNEQMVEDEKTPEPQSKSSRKSDVFPNPKPKEEEEVEGEEEEEETMIVKRIPVPENMKMPLYLLYDTSGSMCGKRVKILKQFLEKYLVGISEDEGNPFNVIYPVEMNKTNTYHDLVPMETEPLKKFVSLIKAHSCANIPTNIEQFLQKVSEEQKKVYACFIVNDMDDEADDPQIHRISDHVGLKKGRKFKSGMKKGDLSEEEEAHRKVKGISVLKIGKKCTPFDTWCSMSFPYDVVDDTNASEAMDRVAGYMMEHSMNQWSHKVDDEATGVVRVARKIKQFTKDVKFQMDHTDVEMNSVVQDIDDYAEKLMEMESDEPENVEETEEMLNKFKKLRGGIVESEERMKKVEKEIEEATDKLNNDAPDVDIIPNDFDEHLERMIVKLKADFKKLEDAQKRAMNPKKKVGFSVMGTIKKLCRGFTKWARMNCNKILINLKSLKGTTTGLQIELKILQGDNKKLTEKQKSLLEKINKLKNDVDKRIHQLERFVKVAPSKPKDKLYQLLEGIGLSGKYKNCANECVKFDDLLTALDNPDVLDGLGFRKIHYPKIIKALRESSKREEEKKRKAGMHDKIFGEYNWKGGRSIMIKDNSAYFENGRYDFEKLSTNAYKIDITCSFGLMKMKC